MQKILKMGCPLLLYLISDIFYSFLYKNVVALYCLWGFFCASHYWYLTILFFLGFLSVVRNCLSFSLGYVISFSFFKNIFYRDISVGY